MPAFSYRTWRPIATAASQMAARTAGIEVVRRRDLDDLLMPALDRAVAFVKVNEVAVPVAQELHLDVLGLADELLDEDVGHAEGGPGLAPRLVERGVERVGRLDDPHAAAAAAHRRLDDHRIAERLGHRLGLLARHDRRVAAGEDRDARLARQLPRGHLVAQQVEQLGRAARRRRSRAARRPGRNRRSPTGSRSRDGSRRPPSPWPARRSPSMFR